MGFSPRTALRWFIILLALLLGLILAVVVTLWLTVTRTQLWLPLLNRQLPDGMELLEAKGLRPGLGGVAWRTIELRWHDQYLLLDSGHAEWRMEALAPLEVRLLRFESVGLSHRLAPPSTSRDANWEALPRFWEQAWWPIFSALSGTIASFDILDHQGTSLLRGAIGWREGFQQGQATLALADSQLTLDWQPDRGVSPASWQARWSSSGDLESEGAANLQWQGDALYFQLQGELLQLLPGDDDAPLTLRSEGQAHLFTTTPAPLLAQWTAKARHSLEEAPLEWQCHGELAIDASLEIGTTLSLCEATRAPLAAKLVGPVVLDWQPLALRWDHDVEIKVVGPFMSGAAYIGGHGCALDADCAIPLQATLDRGDWNNLSWQQGQMSVLLERHSDNTLWLRRGQLELPALSGEGWHLQAMRLSFAEAMLWRDNLTEWILPEIRWRGRFDLESADLALDGEGRLADIRFTAVEDWEAQLESEWELYWQEQRLPRLHLAQQWRSQPGTTLEVTGQLDGALLQPLLRHRLVIKPGAPLHFSGDIDSDSWPLETDIASALLGNNQQRLLIRGLHGNFRAIVSGEIKEEKLELMARGQVERLAGLYGEYAFAGFTVEPFVLRWHDHGVGIDEPLAWAVNELNIGLPIHQLSGELAIRNNAWQLTEVKGELLGGSFHLDRLDEHRQGNITLQDIQLATAVALLNQPDIQVTGTLSGVLPVALEDDTPVIREGRLRNDGPGIIRYRPAPGSDFLAGNPQTALVGDTLRNLHYERLEADVTYLANGDLLLFTRLQGRNPDFEHSPPIHLNLNVEQNIPSLLRSLRAGEDISAWLERRVNPRR